MPPEQNISPSPVSPTPQTSQWQSPIKPLLIALLILVSFGIMDWYAVVHQQEVVKVGDSYTAPDTSDWKTYTDTEFGLEFKYPPSLALPYRDENGKFPTEIGIWNKGESIFSLDYYGVRGTLTKDSVDDSHNLYTVVKIDPQSTRSVIFNLFMGDGDRSVKPLADQIISTFRFLETASTSPTSKDKAMIVLSPNGGETWKIGSTQNIRWEGKNLIDVTAGNEFFTTISLTKIYSPSCNQGYECYDAYGEEPIYKVPTKNGPQTYDYLVSEYLSGKKVEPGTQYRVKVCGLEMGDRSACDESDRVFTVEN